MPGKVWWFGLTLAALVAIAASSFKPQGAAASGFKPQATTASSFKPQASLAGTPLGHLEDGQGLCLDDYGWSTANGAKIDQWQCLYDRTTGLPNANQFWSAHNVSRDGHGYYYLIYNSYSNKCLEDAGWSKSNGAKIDQWTCSEHDPNQQWYPYYAGGENWWLDNRYSNYTLGIAGDGFSNGEQAIQERYVNGKSEQNLSEWWSTTPGMGWVFP